MKKGVCGCVKIGYPKNPKAYHHFPIPTSNSLLGVSPSRRRTIICDIQLYQCFFEETLQNHRVFANANTTDCSNYYPKTAMRISVSLHSCLVQTTRNQN